jgi:hypothetical protein
LVKKLISNDRAAELRLVISNTGGAKYMPSLWNLKALFFQGISPRLGACAHQNKANNLDLRQSGASAAPIRRLKKLKEA